MNNDTNNLNGTVLGSVNSVEPANPSVSPVQPVETPVEPIETLNTEVTPQNNVMPEPIVNEGIANVVEPTPAPSSVVMEPVPEPTPAYTSMQAIEPTPMPGFDNPNVVGTTPPVSFGEENVPKKKGNKLLFVLLILLLIGGVGFGTYYVLKHTDLFNKKTEIKISTKDMNVNLGEELPDSVESYANITGTSPKNCTVDKSSVDVNTEGTYTYTVKCDPVEKSGTITVSDNFGDSLKTKAVYKVKEAGITPDEFVVNPKDSITYEFVDAETVASSMSTAGSYSVTIKATDADGNTSEATAKLIVLEYEIRGFVSCSSNSQTVEGVSAQMTVANKFIIVNDGNNGYGGVAIEDSIFKFSDETEYKGLKNTYSSAKTITIANVTGEAKFDDSELTITISNDLDNASVITEYGEDNMKNYSSISSYFKDTMGYTCTYERSE